MRLLPLAISILLVACGSKNKPKDPLESFRERLQERARLYISLADLDEKGWIKDTKCDGLLFNSLYAAAGGKSDPMEARSADGQWFRHHLKDCYPKGAASTISRDMFMGLFIWIWHNKRLDVIEDLIQYGESHANGVGDWKMGEGDLFRIYFNIGTRAIAYELRYRLGGSDHPIRKVVPEVWFDVHGYEAHLQVLHIYLLGQMRGGVSNLGLAALKDHAQDEPRNALFQAVYHIYSDGDERPAASILLDEYIFPKDRLPSTSERCEGYLWQRDGSKGNDVNPDWLPCREGSRQVFSGVDFLFAKAILFREI